MIDKLDRRSWAAGVEDGIRSLKPEILDAALLLAQRNDLFWYALMLRQGGPDGSELDQAVTEDGDAAIAAVGAELDAWDPAPPAADLLANVREDTRS